MTRNEAIKIYGLGLVEQAENDNCEFFLRQNDGWEIWRGVSTDKNEDGVPCMAIYYQREEDTSSTTDEPIDLGSLDWVIAHYE